MSEQKHYTVIIIGAGPAGVGAAAALSKHGIQSIAVIERNEKIGGISSIYQKKKGGIKTFIRWTRGGIPIFGTQYAAVLERELLKTEAEVKLQSQVIAIDANKKSITYVNDSEGKVEITADAIIMACGAREKTQVERKWIAGSRPSKVLFTKQLIHFLDGHGVLPFKHPVIIGSDLIAYAMAAKLKNAGSHDALIVDRYRSPQCPFYERLYFRRWSHPKYQGVEGTSVSIAGKKTVSGIKIDDKVVSCDGVVICGELIPNSELALTGNLGVDTLSRIPVVANGCELSESGWFVAGNILGGFHNAEWCYFNGNRVAKQVIKRLKR